MFFILFLILTGVIIYGCARVYRKLFKWLTKSETKAQLPDWTKR